MIRDRAPAPLVWTAGRRPLRCTGITLGSALLYALAAVVTLLSVGGQLSAEDTEPAPDVRCLRVLQRTSGIPGARPGEGSRTVHQVLTIHEDGERLVLDEYNSLGHETRQAAPNGDLGPRGFRYIVQLDREPPTITKVWPDDSQYEEIVGDLNKLQRDRNVTERSILRRLRQLNSRERAKVLRDRHLNPDGPGNRKVRVEHGDAETILGKKCDNVLVTENGRVVIDAWVSEEIGGSTYFNLYRRLGAFSEEVLDKLEGLKGLPLRASITVVTKLPSYTLDVEVESIDSALEHDSLFAPPAGAVRIEEEPTVLACPKCKKAVEKSSAHLLLYGGRYLYFCGSKCKNKFVNDDTVIPRPKSKKPKKPSK